MNRERTREKQRTSIVSPHRLTNSYNKQTLWWATTHYSRHNYLQTWRRTWQPPELMSLDALHTITLTLNNESQCTLRGYVILVWRGAGGRARAVARWARDAQSIPTPTVNTRLSQYMSLTCTTLVRSRLSMLLLLNVKIIIIFLKNCYLPIHSNNLHNQYTTHSIKHEWIIHQHKLTS